MKRTLTLATIASIAAATFFGCKKAESTSTSYIMTATVGGKAFSENNTITIGTGTPLSIFSDANISSGPIPPYMELLIHDFAGPGTYDLDSTGLSNMAAYVESRSSMMKKAASGSVIITDTTTTNISGTFSFVCTDGTVVSDGKFTAKRE